jgi:hypothetical protein
MDKNRAAYEKKEADAARQEEMRVNRLKASAAVDAGMMLTPRMEDTPLKASAPTSELNSVDMAGTKTTAQFSPKNPDDTKTETPS